MVINSLQAELAMYYLRHIIPQDNN
jgi:hypothetical protein